MRVRSEGRRRLVPTPGHGESKRCDSACSAVRPRQTAYPMALRLVRAPSFSAPNSRAEVSRSVCPVGSRFDAKPKQKQLRSHRLEYLKEQGYSGVLKCSVRSFCGHEAQVSTGTTRDRASGMRRGVGCCIDRGCRAPRSVMRPVSLAQLLCFEAVPVLNRGSAGRHAR